MTVTGGEGVCAACGRRRRPSGTVVHVDAVPRKRWRTDIGGCAPPQRRGSLHPYGDRRTGNARHVAAGLPGKSVAPASTPRPAEQKQHPSDGDSSGARAVRPLLLSLHPAQRSQRRPPSRSPWLSRRRNLPSVLRRRPDGRSHRTPPLPARQQLPNRCRNVGSHRAVSNRIERVVTHP